MECLPSLPLQIFKRSNQLFSSTVSLLRGYLLSQWANNVPALCFYKPLTVLHVITWLQVLNISSLCMEVEMGVVSELGCSLMADMETGYVWRDVRTFPEVCGVIKPETASRERCTRRRFNIFEGWNRWTFLNQMTFSSHVCGTNTCLVIFQDISWCICVKCPNILSKTTKPTNRTFDGMSEPFQRFVQRWS